MLKKLKYRAVMMVIALSVAGLFSGCVIDGEGGFFTIFGGPKFEEKVIKSVPLEEGGRFSLKNLNGTVTIETWGRDEVEIEAVKKARGSKSYLERVQIKIDSGRNYVDVATIHERRRLRVSVTYFVRVPEGTELESIKSSNGTLKLMGPFGGVHAVTTNGGIQIDDASGPIYLSTTNGTIKAFDLRGGIEAGTTNGSIHLDVLRLTDPIKVRTTNGGIKLFLDEDLDADLSARTTNGRVYVDFPVTVDLSHKNRRRLEARMGNGGPNITLHTTNGSIRISRSN